MKLMNSAMMPQPGNYECKKITKNEFCGLLRLAYGQNNLHSYISYPQNIELIKEWTDIAIEPNRDQTTLNGVDEILVMKLKYRAAMGTKGATVSDEDFEFFYIGYDNFMV